MAQGRMNRADNGYREPQTVIGYLSKIAIGQKVQEEENLKMGSELDKSMLILDSDNL